MKLDLDLVQLDKRLQLITFHLGTRTKDGGPIFQFWLPFDPDVTHLSNIRQIPPFHIQYPGTLIAPISQVQSYSFR